MSMKTRDLVVTLAGLASVCSYAQQQQQPDRVNQAPIVAPTQPARPVTPAKPVVTPRTLQVAPVAQPMGAEQVRKVALQSQPPAGTTQQEQSDLQFIAERARRGDFGGANEKWMRSVNHAIERDGRYKEWIELESWNNHVLNQAYIAPDPELSRAAEKVRVISKERTAANSRRVELTQAKASLVQPTTHTANVRRLNVSENPELNPDPASARELEQPRPGSIDEEISKVDEQLKSLEEDEQLANVELQNALQKQQQTLQMMSNLSRMLHDSAMSVIRKLGG
jgi:hypothetical protein